MIDVSRLSQLQAQSDPPPPGHVSITPKDVSRLGEWKASRGTGTIHPFTSELKGAIIGEVEVRR